MFMPRTQIAIIGWGSLLWCPGSLQIKSVWHHDGPILPVEFARISKDGRLTLVIHPESTGQRTLWAVAVPEDMNAARESLQEREETSPSLIHSGPADGEFSNGVTKEVRDAISRWLEEHQDFRGCVWTGLTSNWKEKQKSDFSIPRVVQYLQTLPNADRAREYIENAPLQIQTAARAAIREKLQWGDAKLSPALCVADSEA
jgi:hypothetical protein